MDQNRNPICKSGSRNVFCPYYGDCLDHAAKLYWQHWDCSECPHKLTQQPIKFDQMASSFGPYCELPLGIHINIRERLECLNEN